MMATQTRFWRHPDAREAFEIARSITSKHARSFYVSAQLLPAEPRWATYGLYGFCRVADNLVDEPNGLSESGIHDRLDALQTDLLHGYAEGGSEDPILHAFVTVALRYGITPHLPQELLDGVRMDIGQRRYATYDELHTYCYRVAGVVGMMMTHVLGHSDPDAFRYAERLGIAMQLTNILRDVDEDRRIGRVYLPQDEMQQFGVLEEYILEGKMTSGLAELMAYQAERSYAGYVEAEPGIDLLSPKCRFAIRSASRIYRGILGKIEARGFDPFQGRVHVPGRSKAGIVLWEALRSSFPTIGRRYLRPNQS